MFYFKKIISYFDYYEYNEKKKSAGYVKIYVKDEKMTLDIQIKGLPKDVAGMYYIRADDSQRSIVCRFLIDKGTGYYNGCCYTGDMDGEGLSAFDVTGLKIIIDENRYCLAEWEWEDIPEEIVKCMPKNMAESVLEVTVENIPEEAPEDISEPEPVLEEEILPHEEPVPTVSFPERVLDDKWKQLCKTYPVCYPFGKDEEYISIAPRDFIILRKEYQVLVNNSFLLHGFYNYQHLILGRKRDNIEEAYYIGVPGSFQEREKKVAVMFGFEGFSHVLEKKNFGYYMRRVEI